MSSEMLRPRKRRPFKMFIGVGRSVLVLLALLSVFATQLVLFTMPTRVYFPFEKMGPPPSGTFAQLSLAQASLNKAPSIQKSAWYTRDGREQIKEELRKARRKLDRLRQDALADYVVTRYVKWHRSMRREPSARKLIWTGVGNSYGFGDRFRGIIHAYLCAVLSERVLIIKWDEPFPLQLIFRAARNMHVFFDPKLDGPDFVTCKYGNPKGDNRCNQSRSTKSRIRAPLFSGHPWCVCNITHLGILLEDHPVVVLRSETPPNVRRFLSAIRDNPKFPISKHLMPLAQSWQNHPSTKQREKNSARFGLGPSEASDDALFVLIFKSLLRPAPQFLRILERQSAVVRSFIPERLKRPLKQLRRPRVGFARVVGGDDDDEIDKENSNIREARHVSVHARLGIGLNETTKYHKRFGLEMLNGSMELLAACMAGHATNLADALDLPEPQRFYLATDTEEFTTLFRREVRKRSHGAIVVGAMGGDDRVHSNRMRNNSPRDRERFLLTATDLFFLSAGDALLSLPSGFANLARWLGAMPHTVVRVPRCAKELWHNNKTEFSGWPDDGNQELG